MPKSFACRPPPERDGIWFNDRFYRTPACCHYETTVRALQKGGLCPTHVTAPPRKFELLEGLKSAELQFPFTMHDNRFQHSDDGENLRGTYRKPRPCCVRALHKGSDPAVFTDVVNPPSSAELLQTTARQSYSEPAAAAWAASVAAAGGRRRFRFEPACPFLDGSCEHRPAGQRRCEPVTVGPPAAQQ